MSELEWYENIRQNILIPKIAYDKSLEIAKGMGLKYVDYLRYLIEADIRRYEDPPPPITDSGYKDLFGSNYLGSKNRLELVKIMHQIRKLL